jgi:signal transduction histidine kinase
VRLDLFEDPAAMPESLPDSAVLALYRIFQESLHNLYRFARATLQSSKQPGLTIFFNCFSLYLGL